MNPIYLTAAAVCALLLGLAATPASADGDAYSFSYVPNSHNTPPSEEDLRVSDREDLAYLDGVLDRIFPDGPKGCHSRRGDMGVGSPTTT